MKLFGDIKADHHWCIEKTFHAIFISPSVDEDYFDDAAESGSHAKRQKTSTQRYQARSKSNVSDLLRLNGKVTGRAIAYAAVLVSKVAVYQLPVAELRLFSVRVQLNRCYNLG